MSALIRELYSVGMKPKSPKMLATQVLPGQAHPGTLLLILHGFSFSGNLF